MHYVTSNKLNQLNKDFYSKVAIYFDSSRRYPWRGWQDLVDFFKRVDFTPKTILDLGCGNGRFLEFLKDNYKDFKYCGIDSSKELLAIAKNRLKNNFFLADLQTDGWSRKAEKISGGYDLIVLMGVMHHIPGKENRVNLIKQSLKLLTNKGYLVFSAWQFLKKVKLPNANTGWQLLDISEQDLDQNDYLLSWNRGTTALRYCHFLDNTEAGELFKICNLQIINEFDADGKDNQLNHYYVLKKHDI
jgi:SAM-dependent methyltransferase